jgi:AraC family transcriptional regulator
MKRETLDEYEKAINRVVDYINRHLYDSPGLKELAEIANMSEFHFHRIFKTVIGENVGEYISRIRLEDIAQRLRMSKTGLQDIAERTGYGTKHALSKAFKKHFGIAPSIYRKQPKNTMLFFKKERTLLDIIPEIRHIDEKKVVYIRIMDWYGAPESYIRAWRELGKFAKRNNLIKDDTEYIGLSFDDPTITPPDKCRFYACFTIKDEIKPTGPFGLQTIKGGQYAVFIHRGTYRKLIDTYYYIYITWLPDSDYQHRSSMSFEKYVNSLSNVEEKDLITEIYVPVIKRKR